MKYQKGAKVRTKREAKLYASDDPPGQPPKGIVNEGVAGEITGGPHYGKCAVRFDNGERGWVSNGDIEIIG